VRDRDRRCVITGVGEGRAQAGWWTGLEACQVFPLAVESHWNGGDYGITMHPRSGGSINLVQNGMLMFGGIHSVFDRYAFSIN
ncbi:hypothetical protein B9Z19DRAFT_912851, partial [Tuber borchii]